MSTNNEGTPTPVTDKEALNALVDDLYTAYCDYNSRQQNKDRFRNIVTAFLERDLTATKQRLSNKGGNGG